MSDKSCLNCIYAVDSFGEMHCGADVNIPACATITKYPIDPENLPEDCPIWEIDPTIAQGTGEGERNG
jgi:hypothetical protein